MQTQTMEGKVRKTSSGQVCTDNRHAQEKHHLGLDRDGWGGAGELSGQATAPQALGCTPTHGQRSSNKYTWPTGF